MRGARSLRTCDTQQACTYTQHSYIALPQLLSLEAKKFHPFAMNFHLSSENEMPLHTFVLSTRTQASKISPSSEAKFTHFIYANVSVNFPPYQ